MQFWNELEGQTIDGLFPLRRLVRSEGRSAWFETETPAPQIGRATISLTEALTDADEVTARLEAAQSLRHPNLVAIAQVGQVRIDNTLVVYAVMEHIEQSLSDVLQSQALSPDEGREVAEALVGALTAVHQNGMSHGHVEAASVLATEQTVKLRSDCLQTNATSQAEDVAGIGGTLFHAFTQRRAGNATDAQMNRIPAPFGEIVRNALARRWSLAQIANALKPAPPVAATAPVAPPARRVDPAPVKPAEPVAVKAAQPVVEKTNPVPPARVPPAPVASAPVPTTPVPPPAAKQEPRDPEAFVATSSAGKRRPIALYGGLALIVLAIIVWLILRPHPVEAPATTTAATAEPAPVPVAAKPSPAPSIGPTPKPPATKPSPTPRAAAPATVANRSTSERTIWRVVVYTYRGQTKASDSVAKITAQHPDLQAAVFNPTGSDVYMVTLGGPMDHPQANAMLSKARSEGLPQDTYVRNFSQ